MSLPEFYEGLWDLATSDPARSVDWIREGYVRCVVKEGIAPRKAGRSGLLADVGCGTGAYSREFSRTSKLTFVGIDLSANALREARRQLVIKHEPRCLGFAQGDAARLPMDSSTFDLIFCAHVLEHIPQDEATLGELHRVLKNGGYMRLIVPNSLDRMFPLFRPLERRLGQLGHLREYTADDLSKELAAHDFRVHRVCYSDFFLAWVLFRVEETLRSMTRRSAFVRKVNRFMLQRRILCRVIARGSSFGIYWENRILAKCSLGMNISCIAQRVE